MKTLAERDVELIWHPCSQMKDYEEFPPIIIEKARGVYLYDSEGNRYIDAVSSWWCNLLGHCNEKINQAVKKQIDSLEHVIFANFSHLPAIELCEALMKVLPTGLTKFMFTDNGSSAIEAALKMSFQYHQQSGQPEKTRFMALTNAYHGETLAALAVSGVDLYSKMYRPLLLEVIHVPAPDCYRCPYQLHYSNCQAECFVDAEKAFAEFGAVTSAFIIEPLVQAAAGMKIYSPVYLQKLRKICDQYNVNFIADEIAVGYGRTGKMFACDHAGVSPDIICLSKGLTGGYMPMALAVTTQKIYDAFYADYNEHKAFLHSHTYSGNPLACAAAGAVLKILAAENILAIAEKNAVYFSNLVQETFSTHKFVADIRSIGLINALELSPNKEAKSSFDSNLRVGYQIYKKALKKGVLLRPLGDVLYFNPPLNISRQDIETMVRVCKESIDEVLG